MKVLTEAEIEFVLIHIENTYGAIQLPKKHWPQFKATIRAGLMNSGFVENICLSCLGTGRKNN